MFDWSNRPPPEIETDEDVADILAGERRDELLDRSIRLYPEPE